MTTEAEKIATAWDTVPRLALRGITAETIADLRDLRKVWRAEVAYWRAAGDDDRVAQCQNILLDIDADLRALLQS